MKAILLVLVVMFVLGVTGHSRFKCPPPRNPSTGLKNFPCDVNTGDFSGTALVISPGPFTIYWEEAISHIGAPWRFSLSQENSDTEACILLDHVPHNDLSRPTFDNESTYTQYAITLNIPNVNCSKCALHLSSPMTDKLNNITNPSTSGPPFYCTDPGTCFSVYHSCANVIITGTQPMSQVTCTPPQGWPYATLSSNNYSTESGTWSNGWLQNVPLVFTTPAGSCNTSSVSRNYWNSLWSLQVLIMFAVCWHSGWSV